MKRRKFLGNLGLTASTAWWSPGELLAKRKSGVNYQYPVPAKLADAVNEDGHLAVRIELAGQLEWLKKTLGTIRCEGAKIDRRKNYFFHSGDTLFAEDADPEIFTEIVSVVWLEAFTDDSVLKIGQDTTLPLSRLLKNPEVAEKKGKNALLVNLLLHYEIGYIDSKTAVPEGVDPQNFSFAIMADPQGGDPGLERYAGANTRMKIHNAFIEDSIQRINELERQPAFTMVLGDYTDHQGEKEHFEAMDRIFGKLKTPILLAIGNHETRYRSEFSPGYNMDAFANFFEAQKRLTGMEKLLYAFDLGKFHFIVWPDPLRTDFWESHPHYFDWLERNLAKNKDRPVIFFQHVPIHPIGIDPLVHYAETPYVKRTVLDLLAKHGNVRYVFSGHVHIPIKSSHKTAVTYQGINFINLPAAGYRPRAFGEVDYFGGPCQGITEVEISGEEVSVRYIDVTRNVFQYPASFPKFEVPSNQLWLYNKWELARSSHLQNGDFDSLAHWHNFYMYEEDEYPTYIARLERTSEGNALFLKAAKRGYEKPGQDRLPQTLNQTTQVFKTETLPRFTLELKVACENYFNLALMGAFIWVEGYFGSSKRYSLIYSAGKIPRKLSSRFSAQEDTQRIHRDLPIRLKEWSEVKLNPATDVTGVPLSIDRVAISLSVWNVNDGNNPGISAYFRKVRQLKPDGKPSQVGGQRLPKKREDLIFNFGIKHIAGEHAYATQDQLYFYDFK